jgi:DNA mismatch repair protein MutS
MTLTDDYLELFQKYESKYGENIILLMQVGSFYESYQIEDEKEGKESIGNTRKLGELCRLVVTKKNKKIEEISRKNPIMCGFPIDQLQKFIEILLKHNYTVIVHDQQVVENTNPPKFTRPLRKIYSIGTIIEENNAENSWILGVLVEQIEHKNIISICSLDVSTGENTLYYFTDKIDDKNFALDSLKSIVISLQPKEIIIYNETKLEKSDLIEDYNGIVHYYIKIKKLFTSVEYQSKLFTQIFRLKSPFEELGLVFYPNLSLIYSLLIMFVHSHDRSIIKYISKPIIVHENTENVQLLGDTITQLDLYHSKNICLFSIINKTSTNMGKRLLYKKLTNPIYNKDKLQRQYSYIEEMKEQGYEQYEKLLKNLPDFERIHRKFSLKLLNPFEFIQLDSGYQQVKLLINEIKSLKNLYTDIYNDKLYKLWLKFIDEYNNTFEMDKLQESSLKNIACNFFKQGIYEDIDELQKTINESMEWIVNMQKKLSNIIDPSKDCIKLVCNDIEGHVFITTNNRSSLLVKKHPELECKNLKGSCKITCSELREYSLSYRQSLQELEKKVKIHYETKLLEWYKKYIKMMDWIVNIVENIDVIKSNTKVAIYNGYCKPCISEEHVIDIKNIRHPIVEVINDSCKYTENNVYMGKDKGNGNIIFGLNSSGKSTYLRAIGLSIIMAQSGMFVPALSFIYSPITKIISKISNRDNILTGKSTFIIELEHMKNMIQRSDKNTLCLCDELCSGTERPSAVGIVTSIVNHLKMKESFFIMSSHFHDLVNTIKDIPFLHFKVIVRDNKLIFDRHLEYGSGDILYGIEIAKCLGLNINVVNDAFSIRDKLMETNQELASTKTSRYNSKVIIENCCICQSKKALHTHHIAFQCQSDKNGMIGIIHKNKKHNLVVLCEECHNKVHREELIINGYKEIGTDIVLDYI